MVRQGQRSSFIAELPTLVAPLSLGCQSKGELVDGRCYILFMSACRPTIAFREQSGTSFNEQFDQHGAWRRAFAQQLKQLAEWMSNHDLMDAAVQERLQRLEGQVRTDKVMVAFVAEFSRGKSELINAIFFADYGRRIMPASAGRTTMCPTELGYDSALPPSLGCFPLKRAFKCKVWQIGV